MGLKLYHIDSQGAHGELDGLPFRLETAGDSWRAQIGEGENGWAREGALNATRRRVAAEVRNMTYMVIAMYRQFQRFGPAEA